MKEIRNINDLETNGVNFGDKIYFLLPEKTLEYKCFYIAPSGQYMLECSFNSNDAIFSELGISMIECCQEAYGYKIDEADLRFGGFPRTASFDLQAIERLIKFVYLKIDKKYKSYNEKPNRFELLDFEK